MRIACKEQHTHEWHSARTGIVTASRVADAMAKLSRASNGRQKGDWAQVHWNYVSELAWERITGQPADHYVSKPMEIGAQYEGEARVEYWMRFGTEVEETGLVLHPRFDYLGASPDGLVGEDGGLEIKVPTFKNHCAYLEDDAVPEQYLGQMYTNMLCCGRAWWDFVSYCPPDIAPEMPDEFRLFRKRLMANAKQFDVIEEAATATMQHVAEKLSVLRQMYPKAEQARTKTHAQLRASMSAIDQTAEIDADWDAVIGRAQ